MEKNWYIINYFYLELKKIPVTFHLNCKALLPLGYASMYLILDHSSILMATAIHLRTDSYQGIHSKANISKAPVARDHGFSHSHCRDLNGGNLV